MKKNILYNPILLFLIVSSLVISCSKNEVINNSTASFIKLTEGYTTGNATKVIIYTESALVNTGYNRFYIQLFDSLSNNAIQNAEILLTPMMDMGTMMHSSPYENPSFFDVKKQVYPCSVTFIMPSTGGNWTLKVTVRYNGKEGYLNIPITVTEPSKSRQKSFTASHNNSKYFISLIEPEHPKVGINDLQIAIYKKASMMSWPADSSLSVILTPEMPTMGHGSPNNVNPVHVGNGHYKGKVNFTMTGFWKLNLDFMSGTAVADTTQFFEVEF